MIQSIFLFGQQSLFNRATDGCRKKFMAITDDPEERLKKYPEEERDRRRAHRAATENVNLPFSIYMVEEA